MTHVSDLRTTRALPAFREALHDLAHRACGVAAVEAPVVAAEDRVRPQFARGREVAREFRRIDEDEVGKQAERGELVEHLWA